MPSHGGKTNHKEQTSQCKRSAQRLFAGRRIEVLEAYMETLRKILEQADANGVAIGHFNISDLVALKAVFEAARELKVPVIVGASEGERQFMGARQVAALVKSLR